MTTTPTEDTPTYWAAAADARFIPAADYVARMRAASPLDDSVTRCSACGQWTWGGRCSLHPDARQDTY